ncbi:SDR family NAD(P)-dependent oxidoreductase [Microbacterium sp. NPDC055910]|uniref:SDR family NAD(P)-dependent oxidoreductase n=1 Tax=Microbacterium sp. NPDC055910 TaxID=3345659 RepID=UPI0035DDEEB8
MSDDVSLEGMSAIVTGAGSGLGRSEALALAQRGANIVVNDLGDAADAVVTEIKALGRDAIAVKGDISSWNLAREAVEAAVDTWGRLDILVNNAGIIRDTMIFNMGEAEWDDVIRIHLKGHAATTHHAAVHWRSAAKASPDGRTYGRIINTSSEAGLVGSPGQPNYSAAKSGITALTLATSGALARYGVTANAIAPRARTDMTSHIFAEDPHPGALDILAPERVATFVSFLASPAAQDITSQLFVVYGRFVALIAAPEVEKRFDADDSVFTVDELRSTLTPYFSGREAGKSFAAWNVTTLDDTGVQNLQAR